MLRKLISTMALALLAGSAFAQVASLELGYCDGKMNTQSADKFSLVGVADDVSAAVHIPAEQVGIYAGCEIKQVRAALASTLNVESLTVWLRSSLDGDNLAETTVTKATDPKMAKGWNELTLDAPYVVPEAATDLYIGMTFHQKNTSVALSVIDPQPSCWQDAFWLKLGSEADWADRTLEGILAIEGVVTGDKLPQYNLTVKGMTLEPTYAVSKGTLAGTVTVRNNAAATITGFDIVCTIDDASDKYTVHVDSPLAYRESATFPFEIHPQGITEAEPTQHTLNLMIDNLTEGADQYMADNVADAPFNVVALYFQRNVLVEEFTTEGCVNCPRVAGQLHKLLDMDEFKDRVYAICHHTGYGEDWLTIPADKTYLWLYGPQYVFAPALMFDRLTSELTSVMDPGSPIYAPAVEEDEALESMSNILRTRMAEPAYVNLNIEVVLTDGNAHVKVTGERAVEVFTANTPRIVVGLIEDNIEARHQTGAEGEYFQQHVNRCYNASWGQNLQFEGDEYCYECDLAVSADYEKKNLNVTAYIWDYDPSDVAKCVVCNAASLPYAEFDDQTTGIESIAADDDMPTEYYDLQGVRLSNPESGKVCIAVKGGKAAKLLVK